MTNLPIAILMLTNVVMTHEPTTGPIPCPEDRPGCLVLHYGITGTNWNRRIETTTITRQSVLSVVDDKIPVFVNHTNADRSVFMEFLHYTNKATHFTNLALVSNYTKTYVKVERWEELTSKVWMQDIPSITNELKTQSHR